MIDGGRGDTKGLRVLALGAENFMRLRAVRVVPRGDVVRVVGRNGQGKTSVLEAIYASLCGAAGLPQTPVRAGAASGETYLDLGEVRVTRRYDASGTTSLRVEGRGGGRVRSPQALLDSLVSKVAFDPLDFAGQPPAKQAELLRGLVGLDLSAEDGSIARLREERADATRAYKALEQEYRAYGPDGDWEAVPDGPVSLADLTRRLSDLHREARANEAARAAFRQTCQRQQEALRAHSRAEEEVARLERRLALAREAGAEARSALAEISSTAEAQRAAVAGLDEPDTQAVEREISAAEAVNRRVDRKKDRAAAAENLRGNMETVKRVGSLLGAALGARARKIAACVLPVPGLALDGEGETVLYNGVPVAQASTAEAVVLGLALAAAANPRLRVARVKDGSLLDDDTLQAVADWAAANDFQVWLEQVGGPASPTGVVIEDGAVLADRQPGPPVPAPPRFGAAALAALEEADDARPEGYDAGMNAP